MAREIRGRSVNRERQDVGSIGGRVSTFVRKSPGTRSLDPKERRAVTDIVRKYEGAERALLKEQQLAYESELSARSSRLGQAQGRGRGKERARIWYEFMKRLEELEAGQMEEWQYIDQAKAEQAQDDMMEYTAEETMMDTGTRARVVNEVYGYLTSRGAFG